METEQWVQRRLPPEVWKMILEYLQDDDPRSLVHCTLTCQTWSDLLKERKPTFLFPMVFPFLVDKYLPKNDALHCRTICKAWKTGVDQVLQNHVGGKWSPRVERSSLAQLGIRVEEALAANNHQYSWAGLNTFYSLEQMEVFRTQMSNHGGGGGNGNPFPRKEILFQTPHQVVNLDPPEEDDSDDDEDGGGGQNDDDEEEDNASVMMHVGLDDLCRQFGSHISSFNYISRDLLMNKLPGMLVHFLNSMPQLQKLTIIQESRLTGIKDAYNSEPLTEKLPELASLSELVISGHHLRALFGSLLTAYGPQLEGLEVGDDFLTTEAKFLTDGCSTNMLGKLQRLKVVTRLGSQAGVRRIHNVSNLSLPSLQKLSIDFPFKFQDNKIPLRSMVALLNRFSSSLVEVHLPVVEQGGLQASPSFWNAKDALSMQVEMETLLPKLEVMGLCHSLLASPSFFRTLSKAPALKRLELYRTGGSSSKYTIGEEVGGGGRPAPKREKLRHPFFALLWKTVPSLKEIVVWTGAWTGSRNGFKMMSVKTGFVYLRPRPGRPLSLNRKAV